MSRWNDVQAESDSDDDWEVMLACAYESEVWVI